MKTRCLTLIAGCLFALPAAAQAQQLTVQPDARVYQGPIYSYPNGFYSPYPTIIAPVPYPGWNYPSHWIYNYIFEADAYRRLNNRYEDVGDGKNYRGRESLSPAVPYSDYLRNQKELLKSREAASKPAPTADKALLEIQMPNDKAKLYFDGKEAAGEGTTRLFHTPALKAGQSYTFTLKAAWPGPGLFDDLSNEQVVSFRAGEHKIVDLRPKN